MATPSSHIKKAQEHASRKEWDKAIAEFERLLERDAAQNASLYNLIGDLNAKKNDIESAFQNYEKAIEIYCQETLYNNAIALCKKCLRVDVNRTEIYNRLGGLYASQGLVQEATHFLSEFADRKKQVGDTRSVETAWKRILEISPDNPKLRVTFANLLLEMHLPGEAAREWTSIADIYRARGDEKGMQAAETRAREILAAAPHATMPSPQAESKAAPASAPAAPASVEPQSDYLAIEWNADDVPSSPGAEQSEAAPLQFTGLFGTSESAGMQAATAAEEEAERIRDDSSAGDGIALDLGAEFAASGALSTEDDAGLDGRKPPGNVSVRERAEQEDDLIDLDEVLDEFRSGVSQVIGNEDSQSHYDLGMSYKEMELFDDAITAFRAAMGADDLRLPAIEMIGECLLAKGDTVEAIAQLASVVESAEGNDPRSIGLRYTLGNAYLRQNDRQRASDCYEAIVAVDPAFRDVAARLEHLRNRTS